MEAMIRGPCRQFLHKLDATLIGAVVMLMVLCGAVATATADDLPFIPDNEGTAEAVDQVADVVQAINLPPPVAILLGDGDYIHQGRVIVIDTGPEVAIWQRNRVLLLDTWAAAPLLFSSSNYSRFFGMMTTNGFTSGRFAGNAISRIHRTNQLDTGPPTALAIIVDIDPARDAAWIRENCGEFTLAVGTASNITNSGRFSGAPSMMALASLLSGGAETGRFAGNAILIVPASPA
jgi:hypothetical protein